MEQTVTEATEPKSNPETSEYFYCETLMAALSHKAWLQ